MVENGRKIRPNIDQKWKPKWNTSWDGFVKDLWWILGAKMGWKIDQTSTKTEIETELKFDRFWKASWSATFSAKRRPTCAQHAPKRVGPRRATAQGRIMEGSGKILTRILESLPRSLARSSPMGRRIEDAHRGRTTARPPLLHGYRLLARTCLITPRTF